MAHDKLDRAAFERARKFVLNDGRPVDRALFRREFEGGADEDVTAALAAYQNADGGFGNALEPDIRLPASSPMATSEAFAILREIGSEAGAGLRARAVQYVIDAYDPARPGWRDVPPEVVDHPHAPWWHREDAAPPPPEAVWGNPDADLVGALHEHAALVPPSLMRELSEVALGRLESAPHPLEPYVARCYLRLAAAAPPPIREPILARLQAGIRDTIDRVDGSSIQVFWLAETPDSPLAPLMADAVHESLTGEIARQSGAGCWEPVWSWGGQYPAAWADARTEWSSQQTVMTLRSLRAWGRLAS